MALIWKDRVLETSTTTGTGALTLAGAITGYRTFASVCSTNDTCYYYIEAVDGSGVPTGSWETGLGTYSGTNTLTRTTVIDSSNSGAAVNFGAGTKRVALSQIATNLGTYTGGAQIFAGALLRISSQQAVTIPHIVTWNTADYNTHNFWSSGTNPSRITIPAGVTKARLTAGIDASVNLSSNSALLVSIIKNGDQAETSGRIVQNAAFNDNFTGIATSVSSSVINVSQGDYFEVRVNSEDTAFEIDSGTNTYFGIEVIEGSIVSLTGSTVLTGSHRYWRISNMQPSASGMTPGMSECYLRSTVGGSNLTPSSSSATETLSGTAVANLYDGNTSTDWRSNASSNLPSVTFDYGSPVAVMEVSMTSINDATYYSGTPQQFVLSFSDDNIKFTSVGTINIGAFSSAAQTKTASIPITLSVVQLASNTNVLTQGTSWANNVFATGTGASQQITLPEAGLSPKDVLVFVNGVRYNSNEYSISGTSLTITTNANNDSIEISKLAGYTTQTSHLTQIGQVTLSSANATIGFSNIPNYYEDLVIVTQARGDNASVEVELRAILNNDTAANYDGQKSHAYSTGTGFSQFIASSNAHIGYIPANSAPSSSQGQSTLEIRNYKRTTFNKGGLCIWSSKNGTGTFSQGTGEYSFEWRNTAAVANVTLSLSAGNFANGSTVTLYGRGGITNVGTPTNINSLSDVDTVTTVPVSGDLLRFDGTNWVPARSAAWKTLASWDFAVDGAVSQVDSGLLTQYNELWILLQAVTTSVSTYRCFRFSVDSGSTYDSGSNYLSIDTTGAVNATDTEGYLHSTASSAARYSSLTVTGIRESGKPKAYYGPRTSDDISLYLVTSPITNVRVLPLAASSTFTGGKLWIMAR